MTGFDEFGQQSRADEARCARQKNTHREVSLG
jgi:hypothetical protein